MAQKNPPRIDDDPGLKRLAMGVFLQLPTDMDEAEQVLGYLAELIKWHRGMPYLWIDGDPTAPGDGSSFGVLPFMKRG